MCERELRPNRVLHRESAEPFVVFGLDRPYALRTQNLVYRIGENKSRLVFIRKVFADIFSLDGFYYSKIMVRNRFDNNCPYMTDR